MTVAKQQTETTPAEQKKLQVGDPELQAMAKIDVILAGLDGETTKRIIHWLTSRNDRKMHGYAEPSVEPKDAANGSEATK